MNSYTMLLKAIADNDLTAVKLLISETKVLQEKDAAALDIAITVLYRALANNSPAGHKITKFLLNYNALNENKYLSSCDLGLVLLNIAQDCSISLAQVRLLTEYKADLKTTWRGRNLVYIVSEQIASEQRLQQGMVLIIKNADQNQLYIAQKRLAKSQNKQRELEQIMEFIQSKPLNNKTPQETMREAIDNNNAMIARDLLKNGEVSVHEKVSYFGDTNETWLHIAIACNALDIATLLLQHGVDINAQTDLKQTPLHYAVIEDRLKMAEWLLNNGADTTIKDMYGWTALDHAYDDANRGIEVLLQNHAKKSKINNI